MKERPIIMQPESVLGILSGAKTMTRRVVKGIPETGLPGAPKSFEAYEFETCDGVSKFGFNGGKEYLSFVCPYGKPGDQLYVKEKWRTLKNYDGLRPSEIGFGAPIQFIDEDPPTNENSMGRWRSPLFLPRWASRIQLQNKSSRVERVQDISEEDAIAEGVEPYEEMAPIMSCDGEWLGDEPRLDYRGPFSQVWNSINAKPKPVKTKGAIAHFIIRYDSFPWEDIRETREHRGKPWHVIGNPWVWCISFSRITKPLKGDCNVDKEENRSC